MPTDTLNVRACIQCGRCSGGCPVSIKSNLNVRKLVYLSLNDIRDPDCAEGAGIWECSTCSTCNDRCPKSVRPADLVVELRSKVIEAGRMSEPVIKALESTYVQGNPWGRAKEKRLEWLEDLKVKVLKPGDAADVLLFVCCTNCYDQRCQPVARAVVKLLQAAKVDFGILGEDEACCSSEQLRMGEAGLFEEMAKANTESINGRTVTRVVTVSPHCMTTFRRDYPGLKLPVLHYTQLLSELLEAGKLKLDSMLDETVTYHDPCYLGKQNKIFEEPRVLLRALAGDRFVELDRSRETSLCCEGGGGRMWAESAFKGRLAEVRVRDSIARGASVLATACPFCLLTLEDAVKTTNSDERIRIRDVAELLVDAL
jgi:Fe-S oxidoreductase